MRAREFTINVPITITINDDDDPVINAAGQTSDEEPTDLDLNPVMVSPLQQELELKKAELGKASPVLDKLVHGEPELGSEEQPIQTMRQSVASPDDQILQRLKQLTAQRR